MTRNLPAIRAQLGLSTAGLARLIGVEQRTVQRYLSGELNVPEPTWRLLEISMAHPVAHRTLERIADDADR